LAQELEAALKTKDKDAIISLFNREGISAAMKANQSQIIDDWLTRELKSVRLSPLPVDFSPSGQQGNVRFHINVQAAGIIEIGFTDGFGMGVPYGKKGDSYFIASAIEELIVAAGAETNLNVTIHVRTAEGRPVPGMGVVCATPESVPALHVKTLYGGNNEFMTDGRGQIRLPLAGTNLYLVAANQQGFGWLRNAELTNEAVLVLRPWGRIEGTRTNRNHAVTGEHLSISWDRAFYGMRFSEPVRMARTESETDSQGRFTLENVPPFKLFIDRQEKQHGYWGRFWPLDARSGGTNRLAIVTRGRTVTGRVKVAHGLDTNLDLTTCSGLLTSSAKDPDASLRSAWFSVSADGTLRADQVEPGDYTISGNIRRAGQRVALLEPISVHVPDDTSDAEDVPFDIGTVALKAAVNLKHGDTAPQFTCTTLDEKPLKLSDFRGQYVLLDFWATWCGPCVVETPNLKATYEAFGKDRRFVMISLSLDAERAAPRRFAREHGFAWRQGFLGDWSQDTVTPAFGVYGIPAVFLIAPDGRILATGLRGPKIKEAVASALSEQQ
jgi:peroxiredoxin